MFVLIKAVQEIREINERYAGKPLDVIQSYSQIHEILKKLLTHEIITESACLHHNIKLDFILLKETYPKENHIALFCRLAEEHHRSYSTIKDIIYADKKIKMDIKEKEN